MAIDRVPEGLIKNSANTLSLRGNLVRQLLCRLRAYKMAIASTESEPSAPSIILVVVRAPPDHLTELERSMREKELVILQVGPSAGC